MYQRINRNSRGQFMRKRERMVFVSARPRKEEVKDKDTGVVTERIVWDKYTYRKAKAAA